MVKGRNDELIKKNNLRSVITVITVTLQRNVYL